MPTKPRYPYSLPYHHTRTPPRILRLLHACSEGGRINKSRGVTGGGGFAHDDLVQAHACRVDLENGGLVEGVARLGDEAFAGGVFGAFYSQGYVRCE